MCPVREIVERPMRNAVFATPSQPPRFGRQASPRCASTGGEPRLAAAVVPLPTRMPDRHCRLLASDIERFEEGRA